MSAATDQSARLQQKLAELQALCESEEALAFASKALTNDGAPLNPERYARWLENSKVAFDDNKTWFENFGKNLATYNKG